MMWIIATVAVHRVLVSLEKWVVLMGGAINRSYISAHFSISAYFLTVQTYKHMRLITRVYSIRIDEPNLALSKRGVVKMGMS